MALFTIHIYQEYCNDVMADCLLSSWVVYMWYLAFFSHISLKISWIIISFIGVINLSNFENQYFFFINIYFFWFYWTYTFHPMCQLCTVYRVIFAHLNLQTVSPVLNSPRQGCVLREIIWDSGIRPVSNSPSDKEAKGAKIKQRRIFPFIQYLRNRTKLDI